RNDRRPSAAPLFPYTTLFRSVKWIMKRGLPGGRSNIQTVAGELGMSNRTLQRRLHDEGTSFKHLLTQVRQEQAREYLADPTLDIDRKSTRLNSSHVSISYAVF